VPEFSAKVIRGSHAFEAVSYFSYPTVNGVHDLVLFLDVACIHAMAVVFSVVVSYVTDAHTLPTYLLPLSLPSTRNVGDIVYFKKKGRIVRLLLTTLDLWKS
jgi:hypothetical protein